MKICKEVVVDCGNVSFAGDQQKVDHSSVSSFSSSNSDGDGRKEQQIQMMVKWPSFVPSGKFPSYKQRYCVYTDYATNNGMLPMLFYTGNDLH